MTQTIDLPDARKSTRTAKPERPAPALEARQGQAKPRPIGRLAAVPNVKQAEPEQPVAPAEPERPAPALESQRRQTKPQPQRQHADLPDVHDDSSRPQAEPKQPPTPSAMTQRAAFDELVRRADAGSETCLAGVRELLDEKPEIWRTVGDLSALAEKRWIELLSNGSKLMEESVPRRLKELKAELAGPHSTPLEQLLVDEVGVTWLASQHGEISAADESGGSLQQANFRLRRAESAQRRFMKALKTLTMIRALVPRGLMPVEAGGHPKKPGA